MINFPFENLLFLGVPNFGQITAQLQCAKNIRTPNNDHFLFATNGKILMLGVPIFKHFRVFDLGSYVSIRYKGIILWILVQSDTTIWRSL